MSASDSEKSAAQGTRQRPIRITDELWDDFGIVAEVLGSDRSALIRDYVRWITFDDSVKPPRRPEQQPPGLHYVPPLPPEIQVMTEGEIRIEAKPKIRYVLYVEGAKEALFEALIEAGVEKGASYQDSTPLMVSTADRKHSLLILKALRDAGITVTSV